MPVLPAAALLACGVMLCKSPATPPPADSLILIASPSGSTAVRAAAEGHTPNELAKLPGALRPLLRNHPHAPELAGRLGLDRIFVLHDLDPAEMDTAAALLRSSGLVQAVAPDPIGALHSSNTDSSIPSDTHFPEQYALANRGQTIGGQPGTPGADIGALEAWEISKGDPDVVIAVFDAGLSERHPDLAPKLVPGWNFMTDTGGTDDQESSHGTHCAGIIGAVTGNHRGVAGLAPRCRLMPVVVVNKYGFGSESTLAEALVWAADQGVPVASVSLGFDPTDGGADDLALRAAVRYATERGMLICASAGNVPGQRIGAPARYPETIAVGATDNRDRAWPETSTGPELSLTAPGVNIISTWDSRWLNARANAYEFKTGTSQACPFVAGAAALVHSINPDLRPAEVRQLLELTTRDLGAPGWDPEYGHGRLDAAAAAEAARQTLGRDPGAARRQCVGDFNGDQAVDTRDFLAYLEGFHQHARRTDIAEPFGDWNSADLLKFIQSWADGCPE